MDVDKFLLIVTAGSRRPDDERISSVYHDDDVYSLIESVYRAGFADGVKSVKQSLTDLYANGHIVWQ